MAEENGRYVIVRRLLVGFGKEERWNEDSRMET